MTGKKVGGVYVEANLDSKPFQQNMGKFQNMTGQIKKWFMSIGIAIAAAFSIGKIKDFFTEASRVAKDFNEENSKFLTVYKDISKEADKTRKYLKEFYGQSRASASRLLSSTGDLLTGLGMTQEQALKLSKTASQLGIDIASFSNYAGGAEGAVVALTKGMLGEREMMKGLGIVISETDLKQRLLAEGKDKLTGLALRQARAELTLQMAMEQSKNAIGDYARTQDSLANKSRMIQNQIEDLMITIGEIANKLVVTDLVNAVSLSLIHI